jgi:hypothetical protein
VNDRFWRAAACQFEAILSGDHVLTLRPQRRNQLLENEPSTQVPWEKTTLGFIVSFLLSVTD